MLSEDTGKKIPVINRYPTIQHRDGKYRRKPACKLSLAVVVGVTLIRTSPSTAMSH